MYGRTTFALSSRSLALSERLKVRLAVGSGCYGGVCVGVSVACVRVCVCVCTCIQSPFNGSEPDVVEQTSYSSRTSSVPVCSL